MDLRQLEAFVAVATARSFRAAASRLNITQPAISSRISNLEAEVGEALFLRDSKPVMLTDKAKEILPFAEQMLELSQQIKHQDRGSSAKVTEKIRIGANSSLVNAWLPQFSGYLHQQIPNLIIDYEIGASHRLRDRMTSGALDVCLMHAPTDIPGVRRQRMCELQAIWAARPEIVPSKKLTLRQLTEHFIVVFGPEADTFTVMKSALRRAGLWPIAYLSTNYADMIVSTIKRTPSVGTVLRDSIRSELLLGELVEIDCEVKLEVYEIYACHSLTKSSGSFPKRVSDLALEFYNEVLPTL